MKRLQNYLLTLMMEESSDIIKASSKIIRYGNNYKFSNYDDMTTEDVLRDELLDAIVVTILLNLTGMKIAPGLVADLLKEDSMFIDVRYRINNMLKFINDNLESLQIDREDFRRLEINARALLNYAENKLKTIEEGKWIISSLK